MEIQGGAYMLSYIFTNTIYYEIFININMFFILKLLETKSCYFIVLEEGVYVHKQWIKKGFYHIKAFRINKNNKNKEECQHL